MSAATGSRADDDNGNDKDDVKSVAPTRSPIFKTSKTCTIGKSFFTLDPLRKQKRDDINEEKVIPPSQVNLMHLKCSYCNRLFTNKSGRTNHMNKCMNKNTKNGNQIEAPLLTSTVDFFTDIAQRNRIEESVKWKRNVFLLPSRRNRSTLKRRHNARGSSSHAYLCTRFSASL